MLPFTIASCSDDDDDAPPPVETGFNAVLDEMAEVPAPVSGTRVRVTITNTAPDTGTLQTPVWIGMHNGGFDVYDVGVTAQMLYPVTNALERLAEDGNPEPLMDAFEASGAGSVQRVVEGELGLGGGSIAPGETISFVLEVDPSDPTNRYFSYASMVVPSNDAFVANGDPLAHEIFDATGTFVASDFVVRGAEVLDAGTEVNDEVPTNTALFGQTTDDTGVDENGVVALHAGFMAMGMGGILDDPMFAEADFTAMGYQMLSFTFDELPAASDAMGAAAVQLRAGNTMVDFDIAAVNLSGPVTGVHFHEGAPGVQGPVVLDLSSFIEDDGSGVVALGGSVMTTPAFVQALQNGDIYVNVHTDLNPTGEVRGQLTTDPAYQGELEVAQEVPAPVLGTGVRVTVRNRAPELGTYQTPVWVGFHDGTFEMFDQGSAASFFFPMSDALERLAEDGNITPLEDEFDTSLAGTVQGVLSGTLADGPLPPGETVSHVFRLDPTNPTHRYLSYGSMVIPSNDAFIANNDPMAHEVFDGGGTFVGADFIVAGAGVLDAGTEVNDEIPMNTAFFGQTTDDTGVDENGVVALHAGFMAMGMGGILDDGMFANADFTAMGYETLEVRLSEVTSFGDPRGIVVASLDEMASEITFAVTAGDLSGPVTGMHFHEGAVGVAGPVVLDLTSSIDVNSGGYLTASGTMPVTSDFIDALRAGDIYLNVHTALNPSGEVRGQVELVD